MKSKIIILMFIAFLLGLATLGIVQSNSAISKAEKMENLASEKSLDSIISKKIDYRFTSYDGKFMYENLVVISSDSVVLGRLILYTNKSEVDSFYNSNDDWRKTKFYKNIKNGTLRILPKIEE